MLAAIEEVWLNVWQEDNDSYLDCNGKYYLIISLCLAGSETLPSNSSIIVPLDRPGCAWLGMSDEHLECHSFASQCGGSIGFP